MNMKKIISILLPAALLFCSAGNASGEAETDCYRAGPVTKTFGTVKLENGQLAFAADSGEN